MVYSCDLCDFSCKQRQDFTRHTNSKKHCENIKRTKETYTISLDNNNKFNEIFAMMNKRMEALEKKNEELDMKNIKLEQKICELKDTITQSGQYNDNRTINHGTINNHYHITLTKYGAESFPDDSKALTDAVKGVHKAIPSLIKLKHFDPRHPENNNIKIPNKKQNKIQIYDGTRWITENKKSTIEDKLQEFTNFMDTDEGQEIYNACSLMIREKLDKLRDFCEKVYSGDKLNREEQRELKRITGDVENIILDHQKKTCFI
jgi:hypothetical protein